MANTSTTPTPVLPNDAKRIALMLAARGVQDADERVLHQLLDFAHRYTSDILEDAQAYADHAMRAGKVEVADVECAVQARSGWEFGEGAPKDYLLPIARELNKIPLPTLNAAYSHISLPEPHLMLGQPNFKLVPHFPAPETLGLFRVGNEDEDEASESGSGSESGSRSEDEDVASKQSPRLGLVEDEPQSTEEWAMVDEGDGEDHEAMNTDPLPSDAPAASPMTEEPPAAVNGIKRSLEENEDHDAA